jgi:hypothetical protein
MAAPKRAPVTTHALQGCTYFRVLGPLLDHWHAAGTTRDRARQPAVVRRSVGHLAVVVLLEPDRDEPAGLAAGHHLGTSPSPLRSAPNRPGDAQ